MEKILSVGWFLPLVMFFAGLFLGTVIVFVRMSRKIKKERLDAVKKSRAVLGGQFGEQIAPYLPKFPCNPGDAHFIGKPVDYIAFCGSAEGECVEEILFIEVKSGAAGLSAREKQVKSCVEEGRVRYVEYRIPV